MKLMKSNPIFHGATAVTLALILLVNASFSSCFVLPSALSNNVLPRSAVNSLCVTTHRMKTKVDGMEERESKIGNSFEVVTTTNDKFIRGGIASMVAMGVVLTLGISAPAFADEYGRESEAQFLSTGETVMICTKRGPLGACTKTERRTVENENDKSEKYFKQPTELVIRKDNEARASDSTEGNELIARLKKQSEENFEKNEALVFQRTQLNDSSASFGPFDGQVLILNEDGKGFSLLTNPQAMRLKKAGFIENKKFIKQPSQEELDGALESGPNILDRFFGSSSD